MCSFSRAPSGRFGCAAHADAAAAAHETQQQPLRRAAVSCGMGDALSQVVARLTVFRSSVLCGKVTRHNAKRNAGCLLCLLLSAAASRPCTCPSHASEEVESSVRRLAELAAGGSVLDQIKPTQISKGRDGASFKAHFNLLRRPASPRKQMQNAAGHLAHSCAGCMLDGGPGAGVCRHSMPEHGWQTQLCDLQCCMTLAITAGQICTACATYNGIVYGSTPVLAECMRHA